MRSLSVKTTGFFVKSAIGFEEKAKNFNPDRFLFRMFHQRNRVDGHLANHICRDKDDHVVAVRCNCGRDTFHPVVVGVVQWGTLLKKKDVRKIIDGELTFRL